MTDRTDDKPVRIDTNQSVNRLARKPALEVAATTLIRARSSHLLRQILQHVMRITVQPVNDIREIHNNRPLPNNLNHRDRQLETLASPGGLCNLR